MLILYQLLHKQYLQYGSFLTHNIDINFGGQLFDQVIEIATVATNYAPLFFLHSHESEFLDGFIPNQQSTLAGTFDFQ